MERAKKVNKKKEKERRGKGKGKERCDEWNGKKLRKEWYKLRVKEEKEEKREQKGGKKKGKEMFRAVGDGGKGEGRGAEKETGTRKQKISK